MMRGVGQFAMLACLIHFYCAFEGEGGGVGGGVTSLIAQCHHTSACTSPEGWYNHSCKCFQFLFFQQKLWTKFINKEHAQNSSLF